MPGGTDRIRQLTGCSKNQKTNETPDPISQTETLGHCETPGQDRRPPPRSPSHRGCPAEGGCRFSPLLFPAGQFEGAETIYVPKGENRVAFQWLVACRVLPATADRAEPSLNPASRGGGAERLGSCREARVSIRHLARSGPATSMEILDAKAWKPHGHQPPLARSAGKKREVMPRFSHPFPAPLALPAGLGAGTGCLGLYLLCTAPSWAAIPSSRALPPGSLRTYLGLSDTNRFKPDFFSERGSGCRCADEQRPARGWSRGSGMGPVGV